MSTPRSVSLFYGSASWHYHPTRALPLLERLALPLVLHGAYNLAFMNGPALRLTLLLYTVVWTGAVFSCAGHKGRPFFASAYTHDAPPRCTVTRLIG